MVALAALGLLAPLFASTSCATTDGPVFVGAFEGSSGGPALGGPDASTPDAPTTNRAMCDTTQCPSGRATCAGDRYACAADLMNDNFNCGRCGNACPGAGEPVGSLNATWACIDGKCEMQCSVNTADCNGVVDDGCETDLASNRLNCTACGKVVGNCSYATIDCAYLGPSATLCGHDCVPDKQQDELNCGGCNIECPTNEELDPAWNAYVGCVGGVCNKRKCYPDFADCNGDLQSNVGDGCEHYGLTDDPKNCGACGVTCAADQICSAGKCLGCPAGEALCDSRTNSTVVGCFVLTSDPASCGSCGHVCPTSPPGTHAATTCVGGLCGFGCEGGYADCDGSMKNGCEVNVRVDPDHCGGCDHRCPLAGQACVEGHCVQAPCDAVVPR